MWYLDEGFDSIVAQGWQKVVYGVPIYRLVVKLKALKTDLKILNKSRFVNIENEVELAARNLKLVQAQIHNNPHDVVLHTQEKDAESIMKD